MELIKYQTMGNKGFGSYLVLFSYIRGLIVCAIILYPLYFGQKIVRDYIPVNQSRPRPQTLP